MRMGPRYGRAPSLYVAAAGVQGAGTTKAEAIVGLRRGTTVTRAPKLNCSGWPRGRLPLRHSCPAGPGATVGPVDTEVPRSVHWRSALGLGLIGQGEVFPRSLWRTGHSPPEDPCREAILPDRGAPPGEESCLNNRSSLERPLTPKETRHVPDDDRAPARADEDCAVPQDAFTKGFLLCV